MLSLSYLHAVVGHVDLMCSPRNTSSIATDFSEELLRSLVPLDIKRLLVTAMSSVSVTQAVLTAGRRVTVLLDTLQGEPGADASEGLAEAVLRCVAALGDASSAAAASTGLAELVDALRLLSASLAAEETLDRATGR